MSDLTTGTVTFLFTDIEGSSDLLQRLGDRRYAEVLEEHRRLLRATLQAGGGQEVETPGEAFLVAFTRAQDAVATAVAAQRTLLNRVWPEGASVRVRMGLHTGEPRGTHGAYIGRDVHRAARICAAGHWGQILLSQATRVLVEHDLPEGVRVRDLGAYYLKGASRPDQLFQLLHPDLPADFPPLRWLYTRPNNLPIPLTSFIGRTKELAEVKQLLATGRLLTLTGAGGCGKTRLALQVATDLLPKYADGVWWVAFAGLLDPALIPQTAASALGLQQEYLRPLPKTLSDFLRPRSVLLVLDNCEHLLSACADLVEALLRACPNLRILATSGEGLAIRGEVTYRVPSLSLPSVEHRPSVGQLIDYEAVRLFIDRALAAVPGFAVTDDNAPALAAVCHLLDGIPLAIELAAAQVKVLSVQQIAAALNDRFKPLTAGSRAARPRHQTLQATMEWSDVLLSEPERMLWRRLSVFLGGFTSDAAKAVCWDAPGTLPDVLNQVAQLVDRSLVIKEQDDGEVRYRLLETVRQYGRDKLLASGEDATIRRRHRDWYLQLAERAEPELQGPDQAVWLDRLEAEHDNLRAALEWSKKDEGGAEPGLRLAAALGHFWFVRGYLTEGRTWLEGMLAARGSATASTRVKALNGAGFLAWLQWDYERAAVQCEESLALSRTLQDKRALASSLNTLGLAATYLGDYSRARQLLAEGLALSKELEDTWSTALSLHHLGYVAWRQGDYEPATSLLEQTLAHFRDRGDKTGIGSTQHVLGLVARSQADYARAVALHQESQALFREQRDPGGIAASQNSLGMIARAQGDYERATALHEESLTLFRELGDKLGVDLALTSLGHVARDQGDYERAMALYKESLTAQRERGEKVGIAQRLEGLAAVAAAQGQPVRAARLLGVAEALRESMGAPLPPPERIHSKRAIAEARDKLDETAFGAAWTQGREMTVAQAIAYALEEN